MKRILQTWLIFGLLLGGCATRNVNPPRARANTGYVDFRTEPSEELIWEVARFDDRKQDFHRVFSEWSPPSGGVLRLAFAPGRHRLRVTFLNRVIVTPAEIEVEVQDGKITPVSVKLTATGTTIVKTSQQNPGDTANRRYGRRASTGSNETTLYGLSAVANPPIAYQIKE